MASDSEIILRLLLAYILGGVIGFERQSRRKSAGLRTNMLVCLGSCLIMLLSEALYKNVEGLTNADPARLAAQVVSGIGFLGAGAIMKEGLTVTGLTTAACLWVVAGVGLAVGAGYYEGAIVTAVLVFLTLGTLSRLDDWVVHERHLSIVIHTLDSPEQITRIRECLTKMGLTIKVARIRAGDETLVNQDNVFVEFEVSNMRLMESAFIADEIKQLDGILGVEVA